MTNKDHEYTIIRRVYAWVGFLTILAILTVAALTLLGNRFIPQAIGRLVPAQQLTALVTAYTSLADETDDTPFINASGTTPHLGSVACPSQYAFGTIVLIDGKQYVCDDRMAARYRDQQHFDVWLPTKDAALKWGAQKLTVAIYD